jgi:hypothetical protein
MNSINNKRYSTSSIIRKTESDLADIYCRTIDADVCDRKIKCALLHTAVCDINERRDNDFVDERFLFASIKEKQNLLNASMTIIMDHEAWIFIYGSVMELINMHLDYLNTPYLERSIYKLTQDYREITSDDLVFEVEILFSIYVQKQIFPPSV